MASRLPYLVLILSLSIPTALGAKECGISALSEIFASEASYTVKFPETPAEIEALMKKLEKTVYSKQIKRWRAANRPLTPTEQEKLWRMAVKDIWNHADAGPRSKIAEARMKIMTNQRRRFAQEKGLDESADRALDFEIGSNDPKLPGMPEGTYILSSGKSGFIYPTQNDFLRNGKAQRFEIEFQFKTPEGRTIVSQGAYGEGHWPWDSRMVYQPNGKGGYELKLTGGAMEIPRGLRGAVADAPEVPRMPHHNTSRNRHIFTPVEWVPGSKGKAAKLIVRDEGSILGMQPSAAANWIEFDANKKWLHAHGYGENFIQDPFDSRKMWVDNQGYSWRIFDVVTKETFMRSSHGHVYSIPSETRSVGFRMDPKNPSKLVPADVLLSNGKPANQPVFFSSNRIPKTNEFAPATKRYPVNPDDVAIEERSLGQDGKVSVITENVPYPVPVLNEGNSSIPGILSVRKDLKLDPGRLNQAVPKKIYAYPESSKPNEDYFALTGSAGEYTNGGLTFDEQIAREKLKEILEKEMGKSIPKEKVLESQYGSYLLLRPAKDGPVGMYEHVLTPDGEDFLDHTKEITQMYGFGWGTGRPQVLVDRYKGLWNEGHGIDLDKLDVDMPHAGYPPTSYDFTHKYRRQQILMPVEFVKKDGRVIMQIRDKHVQTDLKAWRKRKGLDQSNSKR